MQTYPCSQGNQNQTSSLMVHNNFDLQQALAHGNQSQPTVPFSLYAQLSQYSSQNVQNGNGNYLCGQTQRVQTSSANVDSFARQRTLNGNSGNKPLPRVGVNTNVGCFASVPYLNNYTNLTVPHNGGNVPGENQNYCDQTDNFQRTVDKGQRTSIHHSMSAQLSHPAVQNTVHRSTWRTMSLGQAAGNREYGEVDNKLGRSYSIAPPPKTEDANPMMGRGQGSTNWILVNEGSGNPCMVQSFGFNLFQNAQRTTTGQSPTSSGSGQVPSKLFLLPKPIPTNGRNAGTAQGWANGRDKGSSAPSKELLHNSAPESLRNVNGGLNWFNNSNGVCGRSMSVQNGTGPLHKDFPNACTGSAQPPNSSFVQRQDTNFSLVGQQPPPSSRVEDPLGSNFQRVECGRPSAHADPRWLPSNPSQSHSGNMHSSCFQEQSVSRAPGELGCTEPALTAHHPPRQPIISAAENHGVSHRHMLNTSYGQRCSFPNVAMQPCPEFVCRAVHDPPPFSHRHTVTKDQHAEGSPAENVNAVGGRTARCDQALQEHAEMSSSGQAADQGNASKKLFCQQYSKQLNHLPQASNQQSYSPALCVQRAIAVVSPISQQSHGKLVKKSTVAAGAVERKSYEIQHELPLTDKNSTEMVGNELCSTCLPQCEKGDANLTPSPDLMGSKEKSLQHVPEAPSVVCDPEPQPAFAKTDLQSASRDMPREKTDGQTSKWEHPGSELQAIFRMESTGEKPPLERDPGGPETQKKVHVDDTCDQDIDSKECAFDLSTVPTIKWTAERLNMLISTMESVKRASESTTNIMDDIIRLYWGGDCKNLSDSLRTDFYKTLMCGVHELCRKEVDSVIFSQISPTFREKVVDNCYILENGLPFLGQPIYKSSWLNINEQLDDIDREHGFPWSMRLGINTLERCNAQTKTDKAENVNVAKGGAEKPVVEAPEEPQTPVGEDLDSADPLSSIEIHILPPEEARKYFNGYQAETANAEDQQSKAAERGSEKKENGQVEVYCCLSRWIELISGYEDNSVCKCLNKGGLDTKFQEVISASTDGKLVPEKGKEDCCPATKLKETLVHPPVKTLSNECPDAATVVEPPHNSDQDPVVVTEKPLSGCTRVKGPSECMLKEAVLELSSETSAAVDKGLNNVGVESEGVDSSCKEVFIAAAAVSEQLRNKRVSERKPQSPRHPNVGESHGSVTDSWEVSSRHSAFPPKENVYSLGDSHLDAVNKIQEPFSELAGDDTGVKGPSECVRKAAFKRQISAVDEGVCRSREEAHKETGAKPESNPLRVECVSEPKTHRPLRLTVGKGHDAATDASDVPLRHAEAVPKGNIFGLQSMSLDMKDLGKKLGGTVSLKQRLHKRSAPTERDNSKDKIKKKKGNNKEATLCSKPHGPLTAKGKSNPRPQQASEVGPMAVDRCATKEPCRTHKGKRRTECQSDSSSKVSKLVKDTSVRQNPTYKGHKGQVSVISLALYGSQTKSDTFGSKRPCDRTPPPVRPNVNRILAPPKTISFKVKDNERNSLEQNVSVNNPAKQRVYINWRNSLVPQNTYVKSKKQQGKPHRRKKSSLHKDCGSKNTRSPDSGNGSGVGTGFSSSSKLTTVKFGKLENSGGSADKSVRKPVIQTKKPFPHRRSRVEQEHPPSPGLTKKSRKKTQKAERAISPKKLRPVSAELDSEVLEFKLLPASFDFREDRVTKEKPPETRKSAESRKSSRRHGKGRTKARWKIEGNRTKTVEDKDSREVTPASVSPRFRITLEEYRKRFLARGGLKKSEEQNVKC